ncbi:MAG: glycosyltransferase [bacterium]
MDISVIIATYNQPKWFKLALLGYACQEDRDFEIVVADDGSDHRTTDVITQIRETYALPINHIWHEHRGFRKCTILNKATLAAKGDYLIYTDGDCIPRSDFLGWHRTLARKGHFLSGGYIPLPLNMSHAITGNDIINKRINSIFWLLKHGLPFNKRILRLIQNKRIGKLLNFITPSKATWNLCNVSTFKEYVLRVNGFDETLASGGQDREFGERLKNSGIHGVQIRYAAITFHLEHNRPYRTKESIQKIKNRRKEVIREKITTTTQGINLHL